MEIGSKLKEARLKTELTQEMVAEQIGVSLDYLLKGKEPETMSKYVNYLEESTNTVKSKQRFTKLIQIGIYVMLWTGCLIWFWLGKSSDGGFAMAYSLVTFYLILPVATFVISLQIGKDASWGKMRWIMPIFFGAMFSLEGFGTFLMANTLACGNQHFPEVEAAIPGFVISVLGILIGIMMKKKKDKKREMHEDI